MIVSSEAIRAAIKVFVHGYCFGHRLTTEPLFIHSLRRIPRAGTPKQFAESVRICFIDTLDRAQRFAIASRTRVLKPEQIGDNAPFRQCL